MLPVAGQDEFVTGSLALNDEQIDVLDLEKAIAAGARIEAEPILAAEVLS
jgi:hypothetical protein